MRQIGLTMRKSLATQVFDWRLSPADLKRMEELSAIMRDLGLLKKDVPLSSVVDLRWQRQLEQSSR